MDLSGFRPQTWLMSPSFFVVFMTALTAAVACVMGLSTKQQTSNVYLFGGKRMGVFPIAVSFVGSAISSLTLLHTPVVVYLHGTQLLGTLLSLYIAIAIFVCFILPKMHDQQFNSLFEFLELRYSKNTRVVVAAVFIFKTILYLPLVIAVPVASFSRVSEVPSQLALISLCVMYTAIGGFKGIVWSQLLQVMLMISGLVFILFIGCHGVGGFDKILEIANSGGRLELFNINPDPFAQNTLWTTMIGMSISWLYFLAANPGSYQKLVSIQKERNAAKALMWFGIGLTLVKLLIVLFGLVLYAEFSDCDPLTIKEVNKENLVLYYVRKLSEKYHGLETIFCACVLCLTFSSVSSNLNTVSGIIYEDFIKRHCLSEHKELQASTHTKRITILVGTVVALLSLFINDLNSVLFQLLLSIHRFTDGAIVAAFFIGFFEIRVKPQAVTAATLISIGATCWIAYCALWYADAGDIKYSEKPMSTVGCPSNVLSNPDFLPQQRSENAKLHLLHESSESVLTAPHVPRLYQWSFYHYSTIGVVIALVVATVWGDLIYGVSQGQGIDNVITIVEPISELKRKKAAAGKIGSCTNKEIEMTTIKQERDVPDVHKLNKFRGGEAKEK